MLIYVPFIYFTCFAFLHYRKVKQLDLALITIMVYAISGIFSILVDQYDLRFPDAINYEISPIASLSYCFLLSICILPLTNISISNLDSIRPANDDRLLKFLAWFSFLWFMSTVFFAWGDFVTMLTSDMADSRRLVYDGDLVGWMSRLPASLRAVYATINFIFGCKWAFAFLAFFCKFVQRLPNKYFYLFLIASLSYPFDGILGADRSKIAYWIISLVGMFAIFRPLMTEKEKRLMLTLSTAIVALLGTYVVLMTVSRFGDRDYGTIGGSEGGIIGYLGQPYIHFCLYFDNYEPAFTHLGVIFPFTSQFIFGIPAGGTIIQEMMSLQTGFNCGVFYTFIGQIIMGAGKWVAIAFCFIYSILSVVTINRIQHKYSVSVTDLYIFFAISSIVLLGLFGHYYTAPTYTVGVFIMYFILKFATK